MGKKLICAIVLVVVLMGFLSVLTSVHKVEAASATIYIRTDGSVEGTTYIVSGDNVTYVFTADINDAIVVERSNIIVDGNRYTLNGSGSLWDGFDLTSVSNVTIRDINIEGFLSYSIYLESASQCVISGNTVIGSEGGIGLFYSTGIEVSDNEITGCSEAVELVSSLGNVVSGNNITDSSFGVYLDLSNWNMISGNNITYNEGNIYLGNSSENTITSNTITDGAEAVQLYASSNNTISGNSMSDNSKGVWLRSNSAKNLISRNNITGNYGTGIDVSASSNNTLSGNNVTDNLVGVSVGSALVNSVIVKSMNNTILGNNIVKNTNGIDIVGVLFTIISRNHIAENSQYGIILDAASNNTISANNITNNNLGIFYDGLCNNNTAYHNNFIDNTKQVEVSPGDVDTWDDGIEGNYWSNYTGVDLDHDGIGDTPHVIGANNTDYYPLMGCFYGFNTSLGKQVNIISNSTVEDFQYFESNSTIVIHVSNMITNQTYGFCRVRIPHTLMTEPYNVTIDGVEPYYVNYTIYDDGENSWIYFSYQHSTLEIVIIPEFPSVIIPPLFMFLTLIAVVLTKKNRRKATAKTT